MCLESVKDFQKLYKRPAFAYHTPLKQMRTLHQHSCFTDPGSKMILCRGCWWRVPASTAGQENRELWLLVPCYTTTWKLSLIAARLSPGFLLLLYFRVRHSLWFHSTAAVLQHVHPDTHSLIGFDALHPIATDPCYWREWFFWRPCTVSCWLAKQLQTKSKSTGLCPCHRVPVSKFRTAKSMCIFTRSRYCTCLVRRVSNTTC